MKEVQFLNSKKHQWAELENVLSNKQQVSPDVLSELYIQLTDDLSYARTYYPNSNTLKYLNNLSMIVHKEIYKNKKTDKKRFTNFWLYELPLTVRKHHRALLVSFVIFVAMGIIGWVSALNENDFPNLILGDQYLEMTKKNIEKGRPMNVYASGNATDMFFGITFNNIRVAFVAFILGIFGGLGTIYLLITNGIMVGVFLAYFYKTTYFADAMLAIWMHGTIEISIIIVAGAAGLVLGKSLLYPGTFKRNDSLLTGAKDGLKIVIGLVPLFIIAGFIEGFLTRHYYVEPLFTASVIILSLSFIVFYFVSYPIYLEKKINKETSLD